MLRDRPGVGPGTIEELYETVIEQVEKAGKCLVFGKRVMVRLFGGRQRQWSLRSEHAEVPDKNLQRLFFILIRLCDIRGRKFHEWILAKARELIARRRTIADPRLI